MKTQKKQYVAAADVKEGDGLKLWFGCHTVTKIYPYNGIYKDFIINVLRFSNGLEMSNEQNAIYERS